MLLTRTKRSRKKSLTPPGIRLRGECLMTSPAGRGAERRLRVNYRYYNPTDGRWTRRDPIGLVGGMNLYNLNYGLYYSFDYIGYVGVKQFETVPYMFTERYGATITSSKVEKISKEILERTTNKFAGVILELFVDMASPSLKFDGVQVRVVLAFKCVCDDACTFLELFPTTINLMPWNVAITPSMLGKSHAGTVNGFGAGSLPTYEEVMDYIERDYSVIENRRKACEQECDKI